MAMSGSCAARSIRPPGAPEVEAAADKREPRTESAGRLRKVCAGRHPALWARAAAGHPVVRYATPCGISGSHRPVGLNPTIGRTPGRRDRRPTRAGRRAPRQGPRVIGSSGASLRLPRRGGISLGDFRISDWGGGVFGLAGGFVWYRGCGSPLTLPRNGGGGHQCHSQCQCGCRWLDFLECGETNQPIITKCMAARR